MYNMDLLNGNHLGGQPAFPRQPYVPGNKNNITLEQVDPSTFDEDSDDDDFNRGIKPGKKTKGRVKIKMEFIENKLRRYTTFSKRKTGIMKKAYELSTLTGTQVMLLVASETGHVYTFATRKLQPMITSESGKALIQTCLNSPDPPPIGPGQQHAVEQRMNPGGFEETELTYAVEDETGKIPTMDGSNGSYKPTYTLSNSSSSESLVVQTHHHQQQQQQQQTYQLSSTPQSSTVSMATVVQQPMTVVNSSPPSSSPKGGASGGISLQLPVSYPGFIIQPGNTFTIPVQSSPQVTQTSSQTQQVQQQTVYRIPTQAGAQQIISNAPVLQSDTGQQQQRQQTNPATNTTAQTTVLSAGPQQATPALTPSVYMYQTPQGIVYAPATGSIQDKTIFNFQQPATALSVPQDSGGQQQQQQQQQQIITIPVPVSLAGSPQILQLSADSQPVPDLSQPSAAKKQRK